MLSMAYATMRWLIIVRELRVAEQDAHHSQHLSFLAHHLAVMLPTAAFKKFYRRLITLSSSSRRQNPLAWPPIRRQVSSEILPDMDERINRNTCRTPLYHIFRVCSPRISPEKQRCASNSLSIRPPTPQRPSIKTSSRNCQGPSKTLHRG
jgi:hypothetical protein